MKKLLTISLISILSALYCWGADKNPDKAEISFAKTEHDFGYINEKGGNVTCEFEFTNTGNAPLIIIDAVASCGCTKPSYPKRPIEPGKSGKITVTYNPTGRPGAFKKDIKLRTNAHKSRRVVLQIIGSTKNS